LLLFFLAFAGKNAYDYALKSDTVKQQVSVFSDNSDKADKNIDSPFLPGEEKDESQEDREDDDDKDEEFKLSELINYQLIKSETVISKFCFSSSQKSSFTRRFIPFYILFHSWRSFE
jgi:hypothetical protein